MISQFTSVPRYEKVQKAISTYTAQDIFGYTFWGASLQNDTDTADRQKNRPNITWTVLEYVTKS
jgi:hypothetical protein